MGDEIKILEECIIELFEQACEADPDCVGIKCGECPFYRSNLAIAARGFVRELLYERGIETVQGAYRG